MRSFIKAIRTENIWTSEIHVLLIVINLSRCIFLFINIGYSVYVCY